MPFPILPLVVTPTDKTRVADRVRLRALGWISTILRTGLLEAPSMPVSSSALPAAAWPARHGAV
jgi:hypothetical protein